MEPPWTTKGPSNLNTLGQAVLPADTVCGTWGRNHVLYRSNGREASEPGHKASVWSSESGWRVSVWDMLPRGT
jgi:hypothetical protein